MQEICLDHLQPSGAQGSGIGGYDTESLVPILEIVELEPNCEGVSRLRFWFQNRRFRFRFRTDGFPVVFYGFSRFWTIGFVAVFCGSGLISRFSDGFLLFRFGTGCSGTVSVQKILNLNRTTFQKIDGFSSDKLSRFRFRTVTDGYGFGFNRRFGKPWADLLCPFLFLPISSLLSKPSIHLILSALELIRWLLSFVFKWC